MQLMDDSHLNRFIFLYGLDLLVSLFEPIFQLKCLWESWINLYLGIILVTGNYPLLMKFAGLQVP